MALATSTCTGQHQSTPAKLCILAGWRNTLPLQFGTYRCWAAAPAGHRCPAAPLLPAPGLPSPRGCRHPTRTYTTFTVVDLITLQSNLLWPVQPGTLILHPLPGLPCPTRSQSPWRPPTTTAKCSSCWLTACRACSRWGALLRLGLQQQRDCGAGALSCLAAQLLPSCILHALPRLTSPFPPTHRSCAPSAARA